VIEVGELTREELGALVNETLLKAGISSVLSGGSCVSMWTNNRFASLDLDFILGGLHTKNSVKKALATIGFTPKATNSRYYEHKETELTLEFPNGPLAVGDELLDPQNAANIETKTGSLRLLKPTDCVKDRLAAYYHWQDGQAFVQAVGVAKAQNVDWEDLKSWHEKEGITDQFDSFKDTVEAP
jgi:hypothetical protein